MFWQIFQFSLFQCLKAAFVLLTFQFQVSSTLEKQLSLFRACNGLRSYQPTSYGCQGSVFLEWTIGELNRLFSHNVVTMETNAIGWPPWLITFWYDWISEQLYMLIILHISWFLQIQRYQNVINQSGHPVALVSMVTTIWETCLQTCVVSRTKTRVSTYGEEGECIGGHMHMCVGEDMIEGITFWHECLNRITQRCLGESGELERCFRY